MDLLFRMQFWMVPCRLYYMATEALMLAFNRRLALQSWCLFSI